MNWDRLFEDLEGQLASEWEAERAARDAESERLRIAHLTLRERLRALCAQQAAVVVELHGGTRVPVRMRRIGADWVAADSTAAGAMAGQTMLIIPLDGIRGLTTDHRSLLNSLDDATETVASLRERMTLGFMLRDLARRRVPLRLSLSDAEDVHGTIDRAGVDHLDLAVHDAGTVRLASAVQGFRIVPFSAIVAVRLGGDQLL